MIMKKKRKRKSEKMGQVGGGEDWQTYGVRWAGRSPVLASSTAWAAEVFLLEQKLD